jgi:hypothetical protein
MSPLEGGCAAEPRPIDRAHGVLVLRSGPWREAALHAVDYFSRHFVTTDASVALG